MPMNRHAAPAFRIPARCTAAVLMLLLAVPLAALFFAASIHTCSCGMRSGCFCSLLAAKGAHCDKSGTCSMKRPSAPDASALFLVLDLRVRLSPVFGALMPDPEPAGRVVLDLRRIPSSLSSPPDTPPPRLLQAV
jgi:hypothetical protein